MKNTVRLYLVVSGLLAQDAILLEPLNELR